MQTLTTITLTAKTKTPQLSWGTVSQKQFVGLYKVETNKLGLVRESVVFVAGVSDADYCIESIL